MSKHNNGHDLEKNDLTPQNVIANTARFNKQFLDKQIGGNPITVSVGKLLTVMGEQDNTIRILSRILGQDHSDQQLHNMHNELFGGLIDSSGTGREGMHLGDLFNKLTAFINQQNQQIQELVTKINNNVQQMNDQITKSS